MKEEFVLVILNRALAEKTQVLISNIKFLYTHIFRTRQTHTDEVTWSAKRFAKAVGLDWLLAVVIALCHDLGHSPFGHSGEMALDRLLKQYSENGFDHDRQTLRVLTFLEHLREGWNGLNLCPQPLMDIRARGNREHMLSVYAIEGYPQGFMSLEAQLVEFCDKLTFLIHDTEDLLRTGIITPEELCGNQFFARIIDGVESRCSAKICKDQQLFIAQIKKDIYNHFRQSLYENIIELMKFLKANFKQKGIFVTDQKLIMPKPEDYAEFTEVLNWMYQNIYKGRMKERDEKADNAIEALFNLLMNKPKYREIYGIQLPTRDDESIAIKVADKIAFSGERYLVSFLETYLIP